MRNYALDFFRGLATLSIILIHTVFWSGELYLPPYVSNISLFFDVPVFIFLSGIAFNYSNSILKNIKGLLVQWKKWIFFIVFYSLIILIFFREQFTINELLSWIVYVFPKDNSLMVVGGSIWFIPMYIKVTIICSIIICLIKYFDEKNEFRDLKIITLFMLFIFLYAQTIKDTFIFDATISFYCLIYLLGYISHTVKIINVKKLITLESTNFIILIFIFCSLNLNLSSIQSIKFPPSIPYLVISLFSIYLIWFLKDRIKIKEKNLFVFIGKNALFYYFAQGIGSSILYLIYPYITFNNYILKLLYMLITNVLLTTAIAHTLIYLYKKFDNSKIVKKIYNVLKFYQ